MSLTSEQIIEVGKAILPYLRADLTPVELGTAAHNAAAALRRSSGGVEERLREVALEMFNALLGIQVIAQHQIEDLCAIVQEGGRWTAIDRMEMARWQAVAVALDKAAAIRALPEPEDE